MNDRPVTPSASFTATPSKSPEVGSYHDLRSLDALRNLGRHDEKAAIAAAAKQFESVFLQELLKSMRAANEVFEEDDFFGSGDSEFYEQMHDEQMALSLANQQTLGLAESMVQQLSRTAAVARAPALTTAPAALQPAGELSQTLSSTGKLMPVRPPLQAARNSVPVTPQAFVQSILPYAETAAKVLGVDPALLVAQAALETGWGKSLAIAHSTVSGKTLPADADTLRHHYFGIKADSRWQGETVTANTLEYQNGLPQRQRASFRAYASAADAFADYAHFIQSSPRYASAVANANDPEQYARGLQVGGYATDPAYADKLLRVFNSEGLRDVIAEARKLL